MILVVGLGNSGANYINTRHNAGFIVVDMISDRYNFVWQERPKFNAEIATGDCELGKVILCKPTTFMNLSANAVAPLIAFYKIPLENVFVIHDDLDLPLGKLKYKFDGGAGGHNGLKSLDATISSKYHRIRIGIGRPEHAGHDVSDYVLGKFAVTEEKIIKNSLSLLVDKLKLLTDKDLEKFKKEIANIV